MNWRKPIIFSLFYLTGNKIPKILKLSKEWDFADVDQLRELTNAKLSKLLLHAYNNVPYYRDIFADIGVVVDGAVDLSKFNDIPLLTKEIIQNQGENFYSKDYKSRKPYDNTSGGSTGAPANFIQDRNYDQYNTAVKLYFNSFLGKEPGEGEIKLWGSDRDIIKGTLGFKDRLINFLYNRRFFNSYHFGKEDIDNLVELNNNFNPKAYWSYMESALEFAKYLSASKKRFFPPDFVVSTIGPLTDDVKKQIEEGMKCKVYNQYGSREVGVIACQCREQEGLHTFPWNSYVEVVDDNNDPIQQGEGRVVVTTLENYSMPLIRYEIGDVAEAGGNQCPCGRNTFQLKKVLGRTLGYFRKSDGSLAHSHFIVQSLFYRKWLKQFQVIQDRLGHILIKLEPYQDIEVADEDLKDIAAKTRILMGEDCEVDFNIVGKIERSSSGKFIYTICKVK